MIRLKVDTARTAKVLNGLPRNLSESIRKKAIRAAFQPYVKTLRQAWRGARFKGKETHRKAIAAATKLASPKRIGSGDTARIRAQMGIQYGFKGGSKARGRQRIYHLLESGFKHKAGGFPIMGKHISKRWGEANLSRMMNDLAEQIILQAKKALGQPGVR